MLCYVFSEVQTQGTSEANSPSQMAPPHLDVNNPTPSQAYHRPAVDQQNGPVVSSSPPQKVVEASPPPVSAPPSSVPERESGVQSPTLSSTTSPSSAVPSDSRRTSRGAESNSGLKSSNIGGIIVKLLCI